MSYTEHQISWPVQSAGRWSRKCIVELGMLAGCGGNLDAVIWEWQLEVQKDNAGRSADAVAERAGDIDARMLA